MKSAPSSKLLSHEELLGEMDKGWRKDHLPSKVKSSPSFADEHALVGPSSFYRVENCPGSLWLSKDIPDKVTSYAADGNQIHEAAATALKMALDGKIWEPTLERLLRDGWKYDIGHSYVEFCIQTYTKIKQIADGPVRYYIEQKVGVSDYRFGTADCIYIFPKGGKHYLTGIDLKTGSGHIVFASEGTGATDENGDDVYEVNTQLALYAAFAAKTYKITPERCFLFIYQPTLHKEGYDKYIATWEEVEAVFERSTVTELEAIRIMEKGPKPSDFKVGPWCNNFCKAFEAGKCPYIKAHFEDEYLGALDDLTPTVAKNSFHPKDFTTEQKLKVHAVKKQIEEWLKAIDHSLYELLLAGDKKVSKHYKLVEGRSMPSWKNNTEKIAEYLKKNGIKNPYKERELINIGDARKAKIDIEKCLNYSEPKAQMVPISDKREGVAVKDYTEQLEDLDERGDRDTRVGKNISRSGSKKGTSGTGRRKAPAKRQGRSKKKNGKRPA